MYTGILSWPKSKKTSWDWEGRDRISPCVTTAEFLPLQSHPNYPRSSTNCSQNQLPCSAGEQKRFCRLVAPKCGLWLLACNFCTVVLGLQKWDHPLKAEIGLGHCCLKMTLGTSKYTSLILKTLRDIETVRLVRGKKCDLTIQLVPCAQLMDNDILVMFTYQVNSKS